MKEHFICYKFSRSRRLSFIILSLTDQKKYLHNIIHKSGQVTISKFIQVFLSNIHPSKWVYKIDWGDKRSIIMKNKKAILWLKKLCDFAKNSVTHRWIIIHTICQVPEGKLFLLSLEYHEQENKTYVIYLFNYLMLTWEMHSYVNILSEPGMFWLSYYNQI